MVTNDNDLDMELENVSPAYRSSSLRYSFSQKNPIGSQCDLEATLAITNLEELHTECKMKELDREEITIPINTHQRKISHRKHKSKGPSLESILSLHCGSISPFTMSLP